MPLLDLVAAIKGEALTAAEIDRLEIACAELCSPEIAEDLPLLAAVAEHLEAEEGRVRHAYTDHLGFLTIGVGRLIDDRRGGGLSDAEIDILLANDIRDRAAALQGWPAWRRVRHDPVRAAALVAMAFQLGAAGLAQFADTLAAVADGRFDDAARAMLDSRWAQQTPARAYRVAVMMRSGRPL